MYNCLVLLVLTGLPPSGKTSAFVRRASNGNRAAASKAASANTKVLYI